MHRKSADALFLGKSVQKSLYTSFSDGLVRVNNLTRNGGGGRNFCSILISHGGSIHYKFEENKM